MCSVYLLSTDTVVYAVLSLKQRDSQTGEKTGLMVAKATQWGDSGPLSPIEHPPG